MGRDYASKYWALKTREGWKGHDYWYRFLSEDVIAIGWHEIAVRPHNVSQSRLESSIKDTYPNEDAKHRARTIKTFIDIGVGDRVLICQGYSPNQTKDVWIYGFATVTGPFYDDATSDWWAFKHSADIQSVRRNVPKSLLVRILGKQSMLQTLPQISREGFEQLELKLLQSTNLRGGTTDIYSESDIIRIVSQAIGRSGLRVTHTAERVLVNTGLEGRQYLQERYQPKREAEIEIQRGLVPLLNLAMEIAKNKQRDEVDEPDIVEAMKLKCPIKPWC